MSNAERLLWEKEVSDEGAGMRDTAEQKGIKRQENRASRGPGDDLPGQVSTARQTESSPFRR